MDLSVNTRWFTTLIIQLKKVYGLMEECWIMRQLRQQTKLRIRPQMGGFLINRPQIRNLTDRNKMMDYIMTDINKFNS